MKKLIFFSLLISILFLFPFVSSQNILADSLQNYYKLDETTGIIINDIHFGSNGIRGTEIDLNSTGFFNTGYYFDLPQNHFFQQHIFNESWTARLQSTNSFLTFYSYSLWFKANLTNYTINPISQSTSIYSGSLASGNIVGNNTIIENEWTHLFVTFRRSGAGVFGSVYKNGELIWTATSGSFGMRFNQQIYLNGNAIGTRWIVTPSDVSGQDNTLYLGLRRDVNNVYYSQGIFIDEVAIFNQDYGTQADLVSNILYNLGTGLTYEEILNASFSPIRYNNFNDIYDLGATGSVTFSLNGFYDNYNKINVSYFDEILNQTILLSRQIGQQTIVSQGDIKTTLSGTLNVGDITLKIESLGLNKSVNISVTAENDIGYDEQSFIILTSNVTSPFPTEEGVGVGFLKVVDFFTNIFPDKDSLTTRQKISYVFIVLLIVTLLTLFFGWDKESGVSKVALYIAGILDFFVVIYFISIGYISIGLLIVVFVISLALAWLRVRGA